MTALRRMTTLLAGTRDSVSRSLSVFLRDVGHGLLEVSHNTLAVVGLLIVGAIVFMGSRADLRQGVETRLLSWLQERHEARTEGTMDALAALAEPEAISRATFYNLHDLSKEQASVATWLSRRYRVAPEPLSRLVKEAWHVGGKANLDPTLILAVMAIESRFNPFAQSPVGAQGLMQVMTRVHDDKYEAFGGKHAAFDPVTNLRVGVQVLKECINRAGSLEAGLKYYVGAANLPSDGGYAGKVFAEREHLRLVAAGRPVPVNAPLIIAPTTVSLPTAEAETPAQASPIPVAPVDPANKATPEQVALLAS